MDNPPLTCEENLYKKDIKFTNLKANLYQLVSFSAIQAVVRDHAVYSNIFVLLYFQFHGLKNTLLLQDLGTYLFLVRRSVSNNYILTFHTQQNANLRSHFVVTSDGSAKC